MNKETKWEEVGVVTEEMLVSGKHVITTLDGCYYLVLESDHGKYCVDFTGGNSLVSLGNLTITSVSTLKYKSSFLVADKHLKQVWPTALPVTQKQIGKLKCVIEGTQNYLNLLKETLEGLE